MGFDSREQIKLIKMIFQINALLIAMVLFAGKSNAIAEELKSGHKQAANIQVLGKCALVGQLSLT